ncbi:MAG: ribosome biogenesis GTPase YlqF [Bacillota bacterium]|nr:ribosome biogenesis GTPase YlqF [Bacillota bacterium]
MRNDHETEGGAGRPGLLRGHMARALRVARRLLRAVDAVVEVLDARAPRASRYPALARMVAGRPRLLVLAKEDLADPVVTRAWLEALAAAGERAVAVDLREGGGLARLRRELGALLAERQGLRARRLPRVMVVGLPNTGKSTLLNRLAGRGAARTGARPGITRGEQWIRGDGYELLDLPGVLPAALGNRRVLGLLAVCELVGPEVVPEEEAARLLAEWLEAHAPALLEERYGWQPGEPPLEAVARRRGALLPGGLPDLERAGRTLLADFRRGRLGRLSLEAPEDAGPGS